LLHLKDNAVFFMSLGGSTMQLTRISPALQYILARKFPHEDRGMPYGKLEIIEHRSVRTQSSTSCIFSSSLFTLQCSGVNPVLPSYRASLVQRGWFRLPPRAVHNVAVVRHQLATPPHCDVIKARDLHSNLNMVCSYLSASM